MELLLGRTIYRRKHHLGKPPSRTFLTFTKHLATFSPEILISHKGPDAVLTPNGIAQAQVNNVAWKQQIKDGVPLPETLYSSPMRRAAQTLNITWSDILLNKGYLPYVRSPF